MPVFSTTRWSLVLHLQSDRAEEKARALEDLCAAYWRPVYLHVLRKVRDPEQAADLTQGFFVATIARDSMSAADPQRGRFRTFLLTLVDRFLSNELARSTRIKRGGKVTFVPYHVIEETTVDDVSRFEPDDFLRAYDRDWARVIVDQAKERVLATYSRRRQTELAEALLPNLLDTSFDYKALASKLDISTNALKVAVHRMRRRLGDAIRAIVRDTVAEENDVEPELNHLIAVLGDEKP